MTREIWRDTSTVRRSRRSDEKGSERGTKEEDSQEEIRVDAGVQGKEGKR